MRREIGGKGKGQEGEKVQLVVERKVGRREMG